MTVQEGQTAPDFTLPADGGGQIVLSELRGKKVVLYFYPKDDTPGCTKEAVAFTELADDFAHADAVVVGVSRDPVDKHEKFKAKHDLGVTLASDADGSVCEAYGVWTEKKNYGRTYMGIQRATFLIDRDGRIAKVWPKVKVAGHAEEVLVAAQSLA